MKINSALRSQRKGKRSYKRSERGQGLTEFAYILVLVVIVIIVVLAILGPSVGNVFSNLVDVFT